MHNSEEQQGLRDDLFEEVQVANVADLRNLRRQCAITLTVRHPDISEPISFGTFYLAAPLGRVLEALTENVPEFISDMEIGVSEARGASLSSTDFWRAIFGPNLAFEIVVLDSEVE